MEGLIHHILLVGMQSCGVILESFLAVPKYVKHRVTIQHSNSTPRYVPKENESISPCRNLHINVQHYSLQAESETNQISIN